MIAVLCWRFGAYGLVAQRIGRGVAYSTRIGDTFVTGLQA